MQQRMWLVFYVDLNPNEAGDATGVIEANGSPRYIGS